MLYVSTRGDSAPLDLSAALSAGLAPDGGLFVPAQWPAFAPADLADLEPADLPRVAAAILAPFAADDPLSAHIPAICAEAFSFPAPVVQPPGADFHVLELFHGPTAAFKDFGARFLAASLARTRAAAPKPLHILVATSGDTGGAVAAAFHRHPGFRVTILFPRGLVSPTQERQLTCWDDNVRAIAVNGAFDDCQRLVKGAFADPRFRQNADLSSANSINIGRLLPQMTYFAAASLQLWRKTGAPAHFVIPSGNLGHASAALWARRIGLPIGEIVLAHNANRAMVDWVVTGDWRPHPTIATLASAMDVGNPSNAERIHALFPSQSAPTDRLLSAFAIDDKAIAARIRADYFAFGALWCPHTAVAAEVLALRRRGTGGVNGPWAICATAHPAKFPEIVEPLLARSVQTPPALAALPPTRSVPVIAPSLDDLYDLVHSPYEA